MLVAVVTCDVQVHGFRPWSYSGRDVYMVSLTAAHVEDFIIMQDSDCPVISPLT